ncbi:hypothetical protein N9V47_02630 [Luminiphilus sp.]|nr:hypothetical protein [Luminiphilus sp.]MDB2312533.1 hypothetical protein [Luminiphilus sp.]
MSHITLRFQRHVIAGFLASCIAASASATDQALLDILLANGVITEAQHAQLTQKESLSADEVLSSIVVAQPSEPDAPRSEDESHKQAQAVLLDDNIKRAIDDAVTNAVVSESPVVASYGSKGFRFETRDGNFQTNLQWRAQMRYSNPTGSDPRQVSSFEGSSGSSFEPRRLRMKIGGHGFQPWLKYYFEVDLQPGRDVDDSSSKASARVIDYRIDLAKWDWGGATSGSMESGLKP